MNHAGHARQDFGARAELTLPEQARMVDALQVRLQARQPGQPVLRIETHISFVLVTADSAYKFKKAVELGFLDFGTRAKRLHCCEEELRLNRRLAPALYRAVVDITGTPAEPALGGSGPVIDHAVCMGAFSQDGLWDRLASRGALQPHHVDDLAAQLADFHAQAPQAEPGSRFGSAEQVRMPMRDNFSALAGLLPGSVAQQQLAQLARWETQSYEALEPVFEQRRGGGWVRECHGDLHLGNVAEIEGRTTVFDCIEFNDDFRWIDVMSEVAFLTMDLHGHGLHTLAYRFLDRWLQHSGDHDGLRVLRYYQVYRALVRAKVAALRGAQSGPSDTGGQAAAQAGLALALRCSQPSPQALFVTHGFSGSGKTTQTQGLIEQIGAVRIRADVERKRLYGLPAAAHSASAPGTGLYTPQANEATYQRLLDAASLALRAGYAVVLDATFLLRSQRDRARRLAGDAGVRFVLLDFEVDPSVLRHRVRRRSQDGADASEADLSVLERQLRRAEPLAAEERADILRCDAAASDGHVGDAVDWRKQLRMWGLPWIIDPAQCGATRVAPH